MQNPTGEGSRHLKKELLRKGGWGSGEVRNGERESLASSNVDRAKRTRLPRKRLGDRLLRGHGGPRKPQGEWAESGVSLLGCCRGHCWLGACHWLGGVCEKSGSRGCPRKGPGSGRGGRDVGSVPTRTP